VSPQGAAGLDVSRETADRLEAFVALLGQWNRTINLVSRRDEANIWDRHVRDSLQLARFIPAGSSHLIDLGSGGGFPGLVLAIATNIPTHLVESDQRKAAFLREAARHVGAPAIVHAVRAEAASIPPAPVVTARALASVDQLLTWSAHLLAPSGICLFLKGRAAEDELTAASRQWHMRIERSPSLTDPDATILQISEIRRVGH
jgi:16S rRNA (guanine527-N7)-methyltransferase